MDDVEAELIKFGFIPCRIVGHHVEALVDAARDGDREAFEELVRLTHVDVYSLARRLTGDPDDARDVVQEAYSRLLAVDIESLDDVRGWLVTVTSRLCIDRLRSHDRIKRAYVGPWLPEPIVGVARLSPTST